MGAKNQNVRDQVIPAGLLEHEVNVRRPPAMPLQLPEQLAHGPVVRDRVADGLDAVEPEGALLVRDHDAPLAGAFAVRVLHVVVPGAVRLPDVDVHARNGLAVGVLDSAHGEHGLAVRVRRHGRPIG